MSPRPLKPLSVGSVTLQGSRMTAEVFLDRDRLDFFAKVGETTVRGETADACKSATRRALETFGGFVWEKLIEASIDDMPQWNHSSKDGKPRHFEMKGTFSRFERAKKAIITPGRSLYLRRPFLEDLDENDQEEQLKEELRFSSEWHDQADNEYIKPEERDLVIPYTPGLWSALLAIEETVETARLHVKMLLEPKDAGKKLLAIGTNALLLSAGWKKP
jgi:hypothetical protein